MSVLGWRDFDDAPTLDRMMWKFVVIAIPVSVVLLLAFLATNILIITTT